jgi:hypothetical protein
MRAEVYAIISGSTKMFSFGNAAFTQSARKMIKTCGGKYIERL